MDKKQFKKRIFALGSIFLCLTVIYLFSTGLLTTISRYIRREQDEIKAYYTSLYFDTDGRGKSVAIENNIGYVEFNLMNYIGEDVTKRDIEYTIVKPSTFYDADGDPIATANLAGADKLYVLDVWGKPQEVAKSTYLYTVNVLNNTGDTAGSGNYEFKYEKLGTSAVGKTHHVNLQLTRAGSELETDEDISIVVQLIKPYREVFIINMNASSRIITFSQTTTNKFDINFDELHIQSADLYGYFKNGSQRMSKEYTRGTNKYQDTFTSKAVKLTIDWTGFILDEMLLEDLHNGTNGSPDTGTGGSNVNTDATYVDITKPTIAFIKATGTTGQLVIFVPQSSDFSLFFLRTADTGTVKVKIDIYVLDGETSTYKYVAYATEPYRGYTYDSNSQYTVIDKK